MAASATDERVERIWAKLRAQLEIARPRVLAPAMTPFSPWVLIASLLFLPAALVLSFFVRRHVIALTGSDVVVWDVSFWRMNVQQEVQRVPLADSEISLDGSRLTLAERSYFLEPGWHDAASELASLSARTA